MITTIIPATIPTISATPITSSSIRTPAGIALESRILATLRQANSSAFGLRSLRTMMPSTIQTLVRRVLAEHTRYLWDDAGQVAYSCFDQAFTTICIVAQVYGRICIGIKTADAKSPSPEISFPVLQPHVNDHLATADFAKWRKWTEFRDCPEVITMNVEEAEEFLAVDLTSYDLSTIFPMAVDLTSYDLSTIFPMSEEDRETDD